MMNFFARSLALSSLLILTTPTSFASIGGPNDNIAGQTTGDGNGTLSELIEYFLNLGGYLGYNLKEDPSNKGKTKISDSLLNPDPNAEPTALPLTLKLNKTVFNNFLGASFIVNTVPSIAQIISNTAGGPYPDYVNPFASYTLNPGGLTQQASYSSPNPNGISVSQLIDQPPYQSDPIDQAVLNILGTPDYSYCMSPDEKQYKCDYSQQSGNNANQLIVEYQVMANVIGTPLPGTDDFFNYNKIKPLLGQLNANSLITPLMYSDTAFQQGNEGNQGNNRAGTGGLQAMNQQQQAANFIRYATAAVAPMVMPDRGVFDRLVTAAKQPLSVAQQQAQATLANFLTSLRVYAAQISVGVANLYFIMSKRLPQPGEEGKEKTSQALSEFKMASWRLFNPGQHTSDEQTQWIAQINRASSATIQKEIAVLLAEINYQLYLNRQQDERLLLTNTILLLQNSKAAQPNPQLNSPSTGITGTQGSF